MSTFDRMFDLRGRVAAITGANTGLGRAIAEALARAGADIAAIGRSDPAETLATVESLGRRGHWVNADLGARPDYRASSRKSLASSADCTSSSTMRESSAATTPSISPRPTGTPCST